MAVAQVPPIPATQQERRASPWQTVAGCSGIDLPRLASWQRLALALALVLSAGAAAFSYHDVLSLIGVDFRSRAVGTRALLEGHDPYTFAWQPGMPERLRDPFVNHDGTPRLTVPPTVLCLYAPFASLPYRGQRVLSFALEWLALALSVALLARTVPGQRWRVLFLLAAAFFFAFGDFWRMHAERGQVYVFHLLALSAGVLLCQRRGLDLWAAGAAFGLAAALRPNLLVLAPAFLVLGKFRTGLGTLLSFGLAVAATLPLAGVATWQSYLGMGQTYYCRLADPAPSPGRPVPELPPSLEGYDPRPALPEVYSTSLPAHYGAWQESAGLPNIDLGLASALAMAALSAGMLVLLWLGRRRPSPRRTLALVMVLALDLEFFLPHRWSYADVAYLLPLALAGGLLRPRRPGHLAAALLVLLGLAAGQGLFLRHNLYLATLARSLLVMGTLTVLTVRLWLDRLGQRPPTAPCGPPSGGHTIPAWATH
jgi:hypothetical protein